MTDSPSDVLRRRELGSFLRARRDAVQPDDLGLPVRGRRRVKGLRRHEIADLAGVSVTWYTWLEQGRQIRISPVMLDAVARALRLDDASWRYVRRLAGCPDSEPMPPPEELDDDLRQLLDDLLPSPAYVTTAAFDLLGWNRAFVELFGQDPAALPIEHRNALWTFFTSPALRPILRDWDEETEAAVARLRAESAKSPGDPRARAIVADLAATNEDFSALWHRHEVRSFLGYPQTFDHPEVGTIQLQVVQFRPADEPALTLQVHRPCDHESRDRLTQLLARSAS